MLFCLEFSCLQASAGDRRQFPVCCRETDSYTYESPSVWKRQGDKRVLLFLKIKLFVRKLARYEHRLTNTKEKPERFLDVLKKFPAFLYEKLRVEIYKKCYMLFLNSSREDTFLES